MACGKCKECKCGKDKVSMFDTRHPCPMDDCNGFMVELRTMEKRVCSHCFTEIDWKLKKGEKPLILHQR